MKKRTQFMCTGLLLLCLTLGMLGTAQPASAATLSVCPPLGGLYLCPYTTITAAVYAAANGDTITVAASTYHEHDIYVGKNLTFIGAGSGSVTVDAGKAGRIFNIHPNTVSISGMTLTNGYLFTTDGGGIYSTGSLTLEDVIITNNTAATDGGGIASVGSLTMTHSQATGNIADHGGGIYAAGSLTMTNSQVTGNIAGFDGAGIFIDTGSTAHLTNVLIQDNTNTGFGNGGGIELDSASGTGVSTLVLDQVTVDHNTTGGQGAGIYAMHYAMVTITRSTVSNNNGSSGAGIYTNNDATLNMTNDTVAGNVTGSGGQGGGIVTGNATLTNVTVSGNTAGDGGGIASEGTVNLVDTILAGNTCTGIDMKDSECHGPLTSQDYNLIGAAPSQECTISGKTAHNITGQAAKLGALADNGGPTQTMALLTGSPAIGAGNNDTCAITDQRGVARPQGNHCDIGAFEVDNTPPVVVSSVRANASPTHATSVKFTVTFSEAVTKVGKSDFTLSTTGVSGASVTAFSGSGVSRTVTVSTGTGSGNLRLDVPASATITDLAGNLLAYLPYNSGETYTITKIFTVFLPVTLR